MLHRQKEATAAKTAASLSEQLGAAEGLASRSASEICERDSACVGALAHPSARARLSGAPLQKVLQSALSVSVYCVSSQGL